MSTRALLTLATTIVALISTSCGDKEPERETERSGVDSIELQSTPDTITKIDDEGRDTASMEMLDSLVGDTASATKVKENGEVQFVWRFDIQERGGRYQGKVVAVVNGKEHVVIASVDGEYLELERGDFEEAKVPGKALGAAVSLSESGGNVLYAEKVGASVQIFRKRLTDMSQGEQKFQMLKKIELK